MTEDAVTDLTRGVYRRLYSGFTTGQRINKISLQAEAWFWRILATVDDFGNGRADPHLCRDRTAGLRRNVTAKQISGWLREMANVGLIQFYTAKGELFLHVVNFEKTQPAGKNGRRLKRVPLPGESEGIQENPDVVSASENTNDPDPEDDTDNRAQAPGSPPFTSVGFLSTLENFERHRVEIRKPLKPTGRQALFRQLGAMGEKTAITAMETSIANGWQGVFKPKPEFENGNANGSHSKNNQPQRSSGSGYEFKPKSKVC
jgi:hypothetical protein